MRTGFPTLLFSNGAPREEENQDDGNGLTDADFADLGGNDGGLGDEDFDAYGQ